MMSLHLRNRNPSSTCVCVCVCVEVGEPQESYRGERCAKRPMQEIGVKQESKKMMLK